MNICVEYISASYDQKVRDTFTIDVEFKDWLNGLNMIVKFAVDINI
jgi:hypothetical protein